MISFFPTAYPDELIYSQIARYHVRSGYARLSYTVSDVYQNRLVRPDFEFVNPYTLDALKWIPGGCDWATYLEEHTMMAAYVRFLPRQRRLSAAKKLSSQEGNWNNLMAVPKTGDRFMRYCPFCAQEDREQYGETFWHRSHQIQRIRVCPKHRCFLMNSSSQISGKKSPALIDAESVVPTESNIQYCENEIEIQLSQYILDLLAFPLEYGSNLTSGRLLQTRLDAKYKNDSMTIRKMDLLFDDYKTFFGASLPTMTSSQMQKIFNGYLFDPYFICQLALFEGISCQDLAHPPISLPLYGLEQVYQDCAIEHGLDYSIVEQIGETVLKYANSQSRVQRSSGPRKKNWEAFDVKMYPQVQELVNHILSQEGRPRKVSVAAVQDQLKLPQKQLDNMPLCKRYILDHIESNAEYWAREIEWAYYEVLRSGASMNWRHLRNLTNMRPHNLVACIPCIRQPEIKEKMTEIAGELQL